MIYLYCTLLIISSLYSVCAEKLLYTLGKNEVQLHDTNNKQTITFDQYCTINDMIQSNPLTQFLHIDANIHQCALSHLYTHYSNDLALYDILQQHSLHVRLQSASTASDINVVTNELYQSMQPLLLQCNQHVIPLYNGDLSRSITVEDKQHIIDQATLHSDEPHMYPYDSIQIMGQTLSSDWIWFKEYIANHWGKLHTFQTYNAPDTGIIHLNTGKQLSTIYDVDDDDSNTIVNIGIASDWAAGTWESDLIAYSMNQNIDPQITNHNTTQLSNTAYDWTIHLGDIYYIGLDTEIQSNFLGNISHIIDNPPVKGVTWPIGRLGTFVHMGNHEMLSYVVQ